MMEFLDHVNLVVDDIDRMVAFYRDQLGLRITKQATISGAWIAAVTGLAGVVADVVYLSVDRGPGIELIHYRSPAGSPPADRSRPNTPGIRHIAFRVRDIESLAARLQAAGVTMFSGVQRVAAEQVDYGSQRKRMFYCLDPEGNLLELMSMDEERP
jgi:catechol 2,3-dioxygenase-like lactoylglutathione lyase family enzyme